MTIHILFIIVDIKGSVIRGESLENVMLVAFTLIAIITTGRIANEETVLIKF